MSMENNSIYSLVKKWKTFRRELNMKEGWLSRSFKATLQNNNEIKVEAKRFLSLDLDEVGAIEYSVTPLNSDAEISYHTLFRCWNYK